MAVCCASSTTGSNWNQAFSPPAPVVVTLVRADTPFFRVASLGNARCAFPTDVFLSLLDLGLRDQALQYARLLRG